MISKSSVRAYAKEKGYRLAADALPALDEAVRILLTRAIFYTRPAKTIKGADIMRGIGKSENYNTKGGIK